MAGLVHLIQSDHDVTVSSFQATFRQHQNSTNSICVVGASSGGGEGRGTKITESNGSDETFAEAVVGRNGPSELTTEFVGQSGRKWFVSHHILGRGGFGTVVLGRAENGLTVAIKILTKMANSDAVAKEIATMCSLEHEHIVQYYDAGAVPGKLFIVDELMTGGDVLKAAKQFPGNKLAEDDIRVLTKQTLLGLEYLHSHGITHRDIKPANILLTQTGVAKLADFGLAQHHQETVTASTGALQGTPMYLSPEALEGKLSHAQDIWAVGIMVLQLAIGRSPWGENHAMPIALMFHILQNGAPEIPDTLPKQLQKFLSQCLAPLNARPIAAQLAVHPWLSKSCDAGLPE
eukprot:TRINITY_DN65222_c1_g1_i1.p1 TRINITY_DN65222_c1_g1~~TRINITY_DN65222_c1_g1_i1.p1  ORF type:complete len:376 (+),score=34.09 TRINITY_DN65222_c1_g1_i1:88-1128(+)